VQVIRRGSPPT